MSCSTDCNLILCPSATALMLWIQIQISTRAGTTLQALFYLLIKMYTQHPGGFLKHV